MSGPTLPLLPRLRRQGSDRSDRGASLIEGAIIAPVFFACLFMLIEGSFMLRVDLTANHAVREAARVESVQGNKSLTDQEALAKLKASLVSLDTTKIKRIVVWKASGPGDKVPTACKTASQTNLCNSFANADALKVTAGCTSTAGDRFWCPANRKVALSAARGGPPDYVGVWVRYEHHTLTGLFARTVTVEAAAIVRIEPQQR
ncbi:MAG: pilus assembly protein [Microthrixaceae bacterium]